MGQILDSHGRVSIEQRRESFIVHAEYGYRPRRCPIQELKPGDLYRHLFERDDAVTMGPVREVKVLTKQDIRVGEPGEGDGTTDAGFERFPLDGPEIAVVPCDTDGRPTDEEDDPDEALGAVWKETPHPEFDLGDLDDLIAALQHLKSRVAKRVPA